jgi:hypothetical protein
VLFHAAVLGIGCRRLFQERGALLGRPDPVVFEVPNSMAAALVRFHKNTLYRKRRDPRPPKGVGFPDPLSGTLNLEHQFIVIYNDSVLIHRATPRTRDLP